MALCPARRNGNNFEDFFSLVISNYSCELLREKECNGLLDPDLALCSAFSLVFFAREGGGF